MSILRSLLSAALLCIPFILHAAMCMENASGLDDRQAAADTLDPQPPWPTDDFQTAILGYLRYVSWFNLPYSMQKQLAGGVAVINPFTRRPYVSRTR